MNEDNVQTPAVLEESFQIREEIQKVADRLKLYSDQLKDGTSFMKAQDTEDRGEMIASAILAYRHLEDAKMRLGKVAQAFNGGVSNNSR